MHAHDRVVLSHRFACGARDVLHLQAEIAEAVTGHLLLHLAGDLCEPMYGRGATDPRAFVAFLDGVRKAARGTEEATAAALVRVRRRARAGPWGCCRRAPTRASRCCIPSITPRGCGPR